MYDLTTMFKSGLIMVLMAAAPKSLDDVIRANQGRKIRQFRKLHDLSQAGLGAKVNVSAAAVSEWERGLSSPRPHLQVLIAKALQAPWSVLFGLDSESAA